MNGVAKSESFIVFTKNMLIYPWMWNMAKMASDVCWSGGGNILPGLFFFSKKNLHAPVLLFAYVTVLFVETVDRLVMAGVLLYVKWCIIQPWWVREYLSAGIQQASVLILPFTWGKKKKKEQAVLVCQNKLFKHSISVMSWFMACSACHELTTYWLGGKMHALF